MAILYRTFSFSRGNPSFLRQLLTGVGNYSQIHAGWDFALFDYGGANLDQIGRLKVDGVIVIGLHDPDEKVIEAISNLGVPVVHAGELHHHRGFHQASASNIEIGAMGARYLLDLGFRHFAYVGKHGEFSRWRCRGFVEELNRAGHSEIAAHFGEISGSDPVEPSLVHFLRQLSRPVGVLASNDEAGWVTLKAAAEERIRVPEQLAVLGVDDEELWCSLASPALSSIHFSAKETGEIVAAALNDLMNGKTVPLQVQVPRSYVVERQSTAFIHAESPEITNAIHFIRRRFAEDITPTDIAAFAGISRSSLERGVRRVLGRAPFQEILRLRLEMAKGLLVNSDLAIKVIGPRCGFADSKYFATTFRASTGMTPSAYRQHQRGVGPSGLSP